jgi:hypothetical protein
MSTFVIFFCMFTHTLQKKKDEQHKPVLTAQFWHYPSTCSFLLVYFLNFRYAGKGGGVGLDKIVLD